LNHGIDLSEDGKTLYASNSDKAFSWGYDASSITTTTDPTTLVEGMNNTDHNTRTVLASKKVGGMLLVSRGSNSNIDLAAEDITSGHSQIRAFNVTGIAAPYNYSTDGTLMGWGLRNSVGMTEEPATGGIWTVENSVDDIKRNGVDIHNDNPGEELNFLGYLDGTAAPEQGANFGYPTCFAAWNLSTIPGDAGLQVGAPFAINDISAANNDSICAKTTVGPRLTFPAHWAPLDIKFNSKGSVAYITSHGSWYAPFPP
jgi:glucose/arabinose dehydrogenase